MLGENGDKIDAVWYGKKRSSCGAIQHSGDNTTGAGKGDDETIIINLD